MYELAQYVTNSIFYKKVYWPDLKEKERIYFFSIKKEVIDLTRFSRTRKCFYHRDKLAAICESGIIVHNHPNQLLPFPSEPDLNFLVGVTNLGRLKGIYLPNMIVVPNGLGLLYWYTKNDVYKEKLFYPDLDDDTC